MIVNIDIQKRLIESINNSTKSKSQLAKELEISTSAISQIAKGKIMPSLETFANLCRILDVSADYLLCIKNNF